jgi:hypothetical protein
MPQPRISIQSVPSPNDLAGLRPVALDVDLHGRLGEREEGRPEAHGDVVDLEEGLAELLQHPFQVGDIGGPSITSPSTWWNIGEWVASESCR